MKKTLPKELFVLAHDIRSAYNTGAILRTADGTGVGKVYLTGYTPEPFDNSGITPYPTVAQKMIAKTALGSEKTVPWEKWENISPLLEKLKKENFFVIALEQNKKSVNLKEARIKFPAVLILGNETGGLDKKILDQCDLIISIPMRGKKESLNVSVAAGIAMYDLLK